MNLKIKELILNIGKNQSLIKFFKFMQSLKTLRNALKDTRDSADVMVVGIRL